MNKFLIIIALLASTFSIAADQKKEGILYGDKAVILSGFYKGLKGYINDYVRTEKPENDRCYIILETDGLQTWLLCSEIKIVGHRSK